LGFEDKRVTRRIGKHGGDAADKEAAGPEVPLAAWVDAEDGVAKNRSMEPSTPGSLRLQKLKQAIKKRVQQERAIINFCDLKFIIEDELRLQSKAKGKIARDKNRTGWSVQKKAQKLADRLVDELFDSQLDKLRDANEVNQAVVTGFAGYPVLMRPILINRQLEGKLPFAVDASRDSMRANLKECTGRGIILSAEVAASAQYMGTMSKDEGDEQSQQKIQGAFYNVSYLNSLIEQSVGDQPISSSRKPCNNRPIAKHQWERLHLGSDSPARQVTDPRFVKSGRDGRVESRYMSNGHLNRGGGQTGTARSTRPHFDQMETRSNLNAELRNQSRAVTKEFYASGPQYDKNGHLIRKEKKKKPLKGFAASQQRYLPKNY